MINEQNPIIMKRILVTFLFLAAFLAGYSQLNNSGSITVETGANLVVMGDYTSTGAGTIDIDGTVQLKGDFINNGSASAIAAGSIGTVQFNGTSTQEITGTQSTNFTCAVEVNNATGLALTNTQGGNDQTFSGALTLTSGDVTLNDFDLTVGGAIAGADATDHIVTNLSGQLRQSVGGTATTFPIGDGTTYNPVVLTNAGTADVFGVNFGGMPAGWTGTDHYVNGSWFVTEAVAGGSDLTVAPQWAGSQEVTPFDRADCAVGVSDDLGATVNWATSGAATGTDPYQMTGSGFTSVGHFLIGDNFYLAITLNLNVILGGAWNGATMNLDLNTLGLIPLTDPYLTTVTVSSIPASAVDWILVELRDKLNNENVLFSRPFFVDENGQLLNPTDGAVGGKLQAIPRDQYYVAVKHRNHLGVMSANTVDLAAASPAFDFTDPMASVFGTNPMNTDGTVMMLWAGDADGDQQVIYLNAPSDVDPITTEVFYDPTNVDFLEFWTVGPYYNRADTDLNGYVIYLNAPSDMDPITTTVFYDPGNTDFLEFWTVIAQLPEMIP